MSEERDPTQVLTSRTLAALKDARARIERLERVKSGPIAIIGIGCRYPGGVRGPEDFWELVTSGKDAVTQVPSERWDADAYHDPDPQAPGKICTKDGGFVEDFDRFDPWFFGVSPREAAGMDPQQRVFLEVAWEALEHAGKADSVYDSSTGVFAGVCAFDYAGLKFATNRTSAIDPYFATGNALCAVSGRTSYALGLRGPSMTLDTACSSSIVSVHHACQSLRMGECDMALAGGVNLLLTPELSICFSKAGMLSPEGRCRTFDARANGYVRSEGCGVLVLKRLDEALADGDDVIAVIRGSAVNQDGPSGGLTVPSGPAQEDVIRTALAAGNVAPEDVGYVEAHGTGTSLGDPIEVNALVNALGAKRTREDPLLIGSVKTNIGHSEGAAGVAGIIKAALSVSRGQIPAHLHFETPNPHLDWGRLPVEVTSRARTWPTGRSRVAGVSSFGATGTNAHIIVEEPPTVDRSRERRDDPPYLLTVSAKTERALRELAGNYAAHLRRHPGEHPADVCRTASAGRGHHHHRLALTGGSGAELAEKLEAWGEGQPTRQLVTGEAVGGAVAWLFTGQGSQHEGMGRELHASEPVFRDALERCAEILGAHLERPLLDVMWGEEGTRGLIDHTQYTQPALFAFEYSLAELWRSFGVEPAAVLGHSVGEYVAACQAGVFSLEDGLALIAARGRLMAALPPGDMAAVFCNEERASRAVAPHRASLSVAAVNGPELVVLSGAPESVAAAVAALAEEGVSSQPLTVSHAFHSPLMDAMLEPFRQVAEGVRYATPSVPFVSNVTGRLATTEVASPGYWVEHVRRPVMFAAGIGALRAAGHELFLEVGPRPTLTGMARRALGAEDTATWLASAGPGRTTREQSLETLGELYVRGVTDARREDGRPHRIVRLPTYPFERKRCWFSEQPVRREEEHASLPGRRLRLPLSDEIRFESRFSQEHPAYVEDHRLFGELVVAGASHVSTLLLGAREVLGSDRIVMRDVLLQQPMVVPEGGGRVTQIVMNSDGAGSRAAQLVSGGDEGEDDWTVHVSAKVAAAAGGNESAVALSARARELARGKALDEIYPRVESMGHHLGPSFRWIEGVWREGDELVSRLVAPRLPADRGIDFADYLAYPGLIDSCIQPLCVLGPEIVHGQSPGPDDPITIPFCVDRIVTHGAVPHGQGLWCHTQIQRRGDSDGLTADVTLLDDDGRIVLELLGFNARPLSRELVLRALSGSGAPTHWLHELEWQPLEPQAPAAERSTNSVLLVGGDGDVGRRLAAVLQAQGARCSLATTTDDLGATTDDLGAKLAALGTGSSVVHLGALGTTVEDLETARAQGPESVLRLAQALAALPDSNRPRPLWLVTSGAVASSSDESVTSPQATTLWGLARTLVVEAPELDCRNVDVDPAFGDDDLTALARLILQPGDEEQLAVRRGALLAARLVPLANVPAPRDAAAAAAVQPKVVKISEDGVLDNLREVPAERREPGPGEVEIEVRATGLNFRDVLRALGMLKEFEADLGYGTAATMTFGFECAGTVSRVGENTSLRPGDEVIAALTFEGSLATYVTVDAGLVFEKPASIGFEEAATLPLAYLTAAYGLRELCNLERGERILIHAAAGGVGLAAVQVALAAGAEVHATASQAKWPILEAMGVAGVSSSRTTDFADEIRERTNGEGVDIVLNSLTEDFIPKSIDLLKPGGKFVEIGKIGIWDEAGVAERRPDVRYLPFDLWNVYERDPGVIRSVFHGVLDDIGAGRLPPIRHEVFPVAEVARAFRHMAQARHVGKIVVTQPARPAGAAGAAPVRENATYWLTGGLGGLGLELARWLVDRGARSLVLTGRRTPTADASAAVEALRERGAEVVVMQADVSSRDDVARVMKSIEASLPPLRGILHAAGVLDDAALSAQTIEGMRRVMAPKVVGSWNLHVASRETPLDWFVLFSSAASMLGAAGQANYAAANAFLDGLADLRRAEGLPATSICWGPWGEVGMAAELDSRILRGLGARGIETISLADGLGLMEVLLGSDLTTVGVLPMRWPRYLEATYRGQPPRFLAELAPVTEPQEASVGAPAVSEVLGNLRAAPERDRRRVLVGHLREQIAAATGMESGARIEMRQRLFDIGIDSLLAVELRNSLHASLDVSLPTTLIFDYPTLEALADFLLGELELDQPTPENGDGGTSSSGDLAGSSADELAALLEQELVGGSEQEQ